MESSAVYISIHSLLKDPFVILPGEHGIVMHLLGTKSVAALSFLWRFLTHVQFLHVKTQAIFDLRYETTIGEDHADGIFGVDSE